MAIDTAAPPLILPIRTVSRSSEQIGILLVYDYFSVRGFVRELRWLSDSFSALAHYFLSYIADSQGNERQNGWNTM